MSSCQRSTYARAAAIILHDFCESLNIPIMVYGHSTGYAEDYTEIVELFSYAEFEGFDNDDKYRLMDISSRGSNRDGAALRFVAEQLSKRRKKSKFYFWCRTVSLPQADIMGQLPRRFTRNKTRVWTQRRSSHSRCHRRRQRKYRKNIR